MIAVVAQSARQLAEWAAADGEPAIALDGFGDQDTLRVAREWVAIGQGPAFDEPRLLRALETLAARGDVGGWVAGSGFEARMDVLERAAERLPLIGTPPEAWRRLLDPRAFFGTLDALGIAHPEVRFDAPAGPGWLRKDAASCAGAGVVRAAGGASSPSVYWQREVAGVPMSTTWVADGRDAAVLGFNRLLVRSEGERPYLYAGVVGPVPVDDALQSAFTRAVRALAAHCGLRGLGSVDFIVAGGATPLVLEVNARPSASAALYPRAGHGSPLRAHLDACLHGRLPAAPAASGGVRGIETVFARREFMLSEAAAAAIARRTDMHDLPHAGQAFSPGDPVCTLSALGASSDDAGSVVATLAARRDALLDLLETS